jgi:hypothetical protein
MRTVPLARRQSGAALLIFALILVLGTSWMLVSALNKASSEKTATSRTQNGELLRQAKDALIGYVVTHAAATNTSDLDYKHPGRFPCPEATGDAGTANEGFAASSCTLPAIGRLPWRTLGMSKPLDNSGEPLWYVLSTGWNGTAGTFKINSDTPGNLTLDGTANWAIALIIAPGPAITLSPNSSQISAGCVALSQTRSGALDYRNYLECENASSPVDPNFVTSVTGNATNEVFNDQVVAVRTADLMPGLDGVIATRISRDQDLTSALAGVYATADWNATSGTRWLPYAATLGDTSAAGTAGTRAGILPMTYSKQSNGSDCVVSASDPRCNPTFVSWKTGTGLTFTAPLPITTTARYSVYGAQPSMSVPASSPFITVTEVANSNTTRGTLAKLDCSATTSTRISCAITYGRSCGSYPSSCTSQTVQPRVRLTVRAQNVAKAFKAFEIDYVTLFGATVATNYFKSRSTATSYGASPLGVLRSDGDADITTEWLLPSRSCSVSQCYTYTVNIPIALLVDHSVVNSADTVNGWFVMNDWHRVTYYAVGSGYAPGGPGSCSTSTCIMITGGTTSPDYRGAILVYAGRDLLTPAPSPARRPSSTITHYLEGANAVVDDTYETKSASTTFNDRLINLYPYP